MPRFLMVAGARSQVFLLLLAGLLLDGLSNHNSSVCSEIHLGIPDWLVSRFDVKKSMVGALVICRICHYRPEEVISRYINPLRIVGNEVVNVTPPGTLDILLVHLGDHIKHIHCKAVLVQLLVVGTVRAEGGGYR